MINIIKRGTEVNEGINGIFKGYDCLNTYNYVSGKSVYTVSKVIIYENSEIIGSFKWLTSSHSSNNQASALKLDANERIKKVPENKIEKYLSANECIAVSKGRDWNGDLICEVYIPKKLFKGDIIVEEEKSWDNVYEVLYYVEDDIKTQINRKFLKNTFDIDEVKEKMVKEINECTSKEELKKILSKLSLSL